MNRHIQLAEPVLISLEPVALDALKRHAGAAEPETCLLQQLSGSLWGLSRGDQTYLITKSFTSGVALRKTDAGQVLNIESIGESSVQELTEALREGYAISATWLLERTAGDRAKPSEGASALWSALRGTNVPHSTPPTTGDDGDMPLIVQAEKIPPVPMQLAVQGASRQTGGPILPQSEIDALITSLRGRAACPVESDSLVRTPLTLPQGTFPADSIQVAPSGGMRMIPPEQDVEPSNTVPSIQSDGETDQPNYAPPKTPPIQTGVNLEEWVGMGHIAAAVPSEKVAKAESTGGNGTLAELVRGHPYTVIVFDQEEQFTQELDLLRQGFPNGTLLASWEDRMVEMRIGPRIQSRLDLLRAKYRAAAASLEASITRVRQSEQLLPSLERHREQQSSLTAEGEKVTTEMRELHLRQVLSTYEGRMLSRKVFMIEARRQGLLRLLALASYGLLRRPESSIPARARFRRVSARALRCQGELESCFDRLSVLEHETQRRLEYQADWQALVRRQVKINREQEEIVRFIRAATQTMPGGAAGNISAVNEWIHTEWDSVRRRERLLHEWLNYLSEENAWALRTNEETLLLLGDSSLLSQKRITRGARVVLVARQHTGALGTVPENCSSWIMANQAFRVVGSGEGIGEPADPVPALIGEMAEREEIEFEEALRTLGLRQSSSISVDESGGGS